MLHNEFKASLSYRVGPYLEREVESWLSSDEHVLFLQRTKARFTAPLLGSSYCL